MHSKQNHKCISELLQAKDSKNSPTEVEDVRPQALDQSKRENKKDLNDFGQWSLHVLKGALVPFSPNSPHEARRD